MISGLKVFWRRIKTRANFSKKIYHTTILIIIKSDFLDVGYVGIDPRQIKIENLGYMEIGDQPGTGPANYARREHVTDAEIKQREKKSKVTGLEKHGILLLTCICNQSMK